MHASELLLRACRLENIKPNSNLVLHSDNGGPMKGQTMLAMMQWLGVKPSFNRPRVSNDNAYSESLFNTAKHNTPFRYPAYFDSLTHCRMWARKFVDWYNSENFNSGINYITPNSRHTGKDSDIFSNRNVVYLNPVNLKTKKKQKSNEIFAQLA